MKLDLRRRILIASFVLLASVCAIAFGFSRMFVEQATVAAIESDLRHRVQLGLVTSGSWPDSPSEGEGWRDLCWRLAAASGARVSIIRRDGVVLGDSDVDAAQFHRIDNHRLRPELQGALQNGIGVARRHSHTVGRDLLYVAMPFGQDPRQPAGVLRMAMPLDAVDREVAVVQRGISIGAGVAFLLAAAIAFYASSWISRGSRELVEAAKRLSSGDLQVRLPEVERSDLAELGKVLQHLSSRLASTSRDLDTERNWTSGILARMREGVLLVDGEQKILLVNPALREMLLLDEDAIGKPLLESVRHSNLKRLLDQVREEGSASRSEIEVGGLKPRHLLVRAAPLGFGHAVFAIVLDLTELRQLQSLRKDLVDNVSHELRNPVSAIRSAAETIRDLSRLDPRSLETLVGVIARQTERLGALVDDLMELSRIESREFKVLVQAVDLPTAIDLTLGSLGERARKQGQSLVVSVPAGFPSLATDARALDHVLTNLLDNAIKYAGIGALIRIQAELRDGQARICVEDTGPGIAEEHLPRLFERFYRVDSGRSREQGGTGLGLSIVKHLLESMGSRIQVESTLGVGTRFMFSLPVAAGADDATALSA